MRGLGSVYQRGEVWWVVRLLRHRLAGLNLRGPCGPLHPAPRRRGTTGACLHWSKSRVANLKSLFGGVRAAEITTHRMRTPETSQCVSQGRHACLKAYKKS